MEEISCKIMGLSFSNKGTGYHVLRCVSVDDSKAVTVKGTFPDVNVSVGLKAKFRGRWEDHPKFGRQFHAAVMELVPEKGANGVVKYLVNYVKSIGPVTAGKLYAAYGDELLTILDSDPEKISECGFLSSTQVKAIIDEWKHASASRSASIFLTNAGLNGSQVRSVYGKFGAKTVELVKEDPYCLYECDGVGIATADSVARKLGIGRDDPRRCKALVLFALTDLGFSDGHMYATSDQIKSHIQKLLVKGTLESFSYGEYLSDSHFYSAMDGLRQAEKIHVEGTDIYTMSNWRNESEAAAALGVMLAQSPIGKNGLGSMLSDFEKRKNLSFSEDQRKAFLILEESRVGVISGYPGTGKTLLVSAFVDLFERLGMHYVLMSPTGIAAKRLSQVTKKSAGTIHRCLGFKQNAWTFHKGNKFHVDAVIVDEMSMVDGSTFYHLVTALSPDTVLIMVGDPAQLPSVGAGHVLHSLIRSGKVPHVALTRIYRQDGASDIVKVAHSILGGKKVDTSLHMDSQFVFLEMGKSSVMGEICTLTSKMKDRGANFQVIAPMYGGDLGVDRLNQELREVLNPDYRSGNASKIDVGSQSLYEGDRVMIIKNDYERMIYNGDTGKIQRISLKDDVVEVRVFDWFDQEASVPTYVDKVFTFKVEEARNVLRVAFACTAHKVQGQEFDFVVLPMTMQYGIMLYRNLVYTAITRAKKRVFVFGDPSAFGFAAENERETVRNTNLGFLISAPSARLPSEESTDIPPVPA